MTKVLLDDDDEKSLIAIEHEVEKIVKQYGIVPWAAYLSRMAQIAVYQGLVQDEPH